MVTKRTSQQYIFSSTLSAIKSNPMSISSITTKYLGDSCACNVGRIALVIEQFVTNGIAIPCIKDGELKFKLSDAMFRGK